MDKDTQKQIQEEVQRAFDKNYFSAIPKIPPHQHNGIDNLQVDPAISLTGFPVIAVVPTDNAPSGTIRLYFDGTNYRLYARISNQWKGVILS